MDGSASRAEEKREEGRRAKDVDAGSREAPPFAKTAKDGATHFFNQGFTQKHPLLLHLKTSPGMQRITELGDERVGFLACSA